MRQLLRIRDFRLIWSAQATSYFGDGLTGLALLILTQRLTGSVTAVALTAIAIALPQLLVGLAAGVYVDRWNRKTVMVVSDLVRAALVLGFVLVDDAGRMWLLYTLAFLQASFGTFFTPARTALVPAIVGRDHLLAANSLSETTRVVAMLLGTAVAGMVASLDDLLWTAFVLDAATFLASAVLVMRILTSGRPAARPTPSHAWADLVAGLRAAMASRVLVAVIVAAAVLALGLGSVNVLLVPFIIDDLRVSAAWFGPLEAAQVVAMVLAGSLLALFARRVRPTSTVSMGLAGLGLVVAAAALVRQPWQMVLVLFAAGWLVTPVQASVTTLLQSETADELRGRIGSVFSTVVTTASVVSMALAGTAAALVGIRGVFVAAGVVAVAAGLLAFALFAAASPIPPAATRLRPVAAPEQEKLG